jgi:hypothetical protein
MNTEEAIKDIISQIESLQEKQKSFPQGSPQWVDIGIKISDLRQMLKKLKAKSEVSEVSKMSELNKKPTRSKATPSKALREAMDSISQHMSQELTDKTRKSNKKEPRMRP